MVDLKARPHCVYMADCVDMTGKRWAKIGMTSDLKGRLARLRCTPWLKDFRLIGYFQHPSRQTAMLDEQKWHSCFRSPDYGPTDQQGQSRGEFHPWNIMNVWLFAAQPEVRVCPEFLR
jgi:hypothetical protein